MIWIRATSVIIEEPAKVPVMQDRRYPSTDRVPVTCLYQGCGSAFILCGSGSSSFSECGSRSRSSLTKFEEKNYEEFSYVVKNIKDCSKVRNNGAYANLLFKNLTALVCTVCHSTKLCSNPIVRTGRNHNFHYFFTCTLGLGYQQPTAAADPAAAVGVYHIQHVKVVVPRR